jgi:hypothetical protein
METKVCNTCKKEKPLVDFYRRGGKPIINCKSCRESGLARQNYESKRAKDFFKKYGITYSEYGEMLSAQNNQCAICGSTNPKGRWSYSGDRAFCVDHDHATGKVRGLLCNTCNQGLGNFFDNIENLERAIVYLRSRGNAL